MECCTSISAVNVALALSYHSARRRFAAGILRCRDNLEIAVFQFRVNFLPAWQIEPASSPGRPGDHQDLLAAKIVMKRTVWPSRSGTAKSGAMRELYEGAAQTGISPKLQTRGVRIHVRLPRIPGEAGRLNPFAAGSDPSKRDAQIVAASACGFTSKPFDFGQIGCAHPKILGRGGSSQPASSGRRRVQWRGARRGRGNTAGPEYGSGSGKQQPASIQHEGLLISILRCATISGLEHALHSEPDRGYGYARGRGDGTNRSHC